jgi:peptidoglycan/xylan/chitin deacetylase (PgdA/CDA1 family)
MLKSLIKIIVVKTFVILGKSDKGSFVLNYHDVCPGCKISPEYFEYQIKYFLNNGYVFASSVEELSLPKRILLTFDDAYVSFSSHIINILKKHNIPCVLFVPTKYLGRKLSDDISSLEYRDKSVMSISELKKVYETGLVKLGSHTHSHINMCGKSEPFLHDDITKSLDILSTITENEIDYFAYPQGRYDENSVALLGRMGFRYSFTTENRSYDHVKSPLLIPRYPGDYFLSDSYLGLSRSTNCNIYMKLFFN